MVFGGGGEISPRRLENQGAGSSGPAWRSAGRDTVGIGSSNRGGVCSDSTCGFDHGAGFAIRTEPRSARIFRGGQQRNPAGNREFSEHAIVWRAREKRPSAGTAGGPEQGSGRHREGTGRFSQSTHGRIAVHAMPVA